MAIISSTLSVVGEIMIAYTVLAVHGRVSKEQKIDAFVFRAMKREKFIGVLGIIFVVLGYLLHMFQILKTT